MQIKEIGPPYAGDRFHFTVVGGIRPIHIEAHIGKKQVLDTDCPDPPCHEIKQDRETEWRKHALELTKLDLERKLKTR